MNDAIARLTDKGAVVPEELLKKKKELEVETQESGVTNVSGVSVASTASSGSISSP